MKEIANIVGHTFGGKFQKANRSKIDSFTGIGDIKALKILSKIGNELKIPVTTDVHEVSDIDKERRYYSNSCIFSRQTDLLVVAAKVVKL